MSTPAEMPANGPKTAQVALAQAGSIQPAKFSPEAYSAGFAAGRNSAREIIQAWRKVAKDRGDVLFADRLGRLLQAVRRSSPV